VIFENLTIHKRKEKLVNFTLEKEVPKRPNLLLKIQKMSKKKKTMVVK